MIVQVYGKRGPSALHRYDPRAKALLLLAFLVLFFLPLHVWHLGIYLGVLLLVLLFGGAYLAFSPANSETVRAAAVTRSFDVDEMVKYCKETFEGEELSECYLQGINQRTLDEFLEGSNQAADVGAKIIV